MRPKLPIEAARRFGSRVLVSPVENKPKWWNWKCDCGATGASKVAADFYYSKRCWWCNPRGAPTPAVKGANQPARMANRAAPTSDVSDQRFGRLVAVRPALRTSQTHGTKWVCRCDCGEETEVRLKDLGNGNTTSCGCRKVEILRAHRWASGVTIVPKLPRAILKTDAGRAAVAVAWLGGATQADLGAIFGLRGGGADISRAIHRLIWKYARPETTAKLIGIDKMAAARKAVEQYMRQRVGGAI